MRTRKRVAVSFAVVRCGEPIIGMLSQLQEPIHASGESFDRTNLSRQRTSCARHAERATRNIYGQCERAQKVSEEQPTYGGPSYHRQRASDGDS